MNMNDPRGKALGKELKGVILKQIKKNDPPCSRTTYNRLMVEVGDEDEVIRMMACVLSTELYQILKEQRVFDLDRYERLLNRLPDESYLDSGE